MLIGSTLGLLAVTPGRLYSNDHPAAGAPHSPLRFPMIRVTLTAALGWIFAIPLRPYLFRALQFTQIALLAVRGSLSSLGAIPLTATAGIAGWLEFLLLRRALGKRIGAIALPGAFQSKLWIAAIGAGIVAVAVETIAGGLASHLPFPHIVEAALVCGVFGVFYFFVAFALGVPEAEATMRRFVRR